MKRAALAALGGVLLLAGCSSFTQAITMQAQPAETCGHPDGLVLIVGAHRDAPRPSLDQRTACQVAAVIKDGRPLILVGASGQPTVLTPDLLSMRGGTLAQQGSPKLDEDMQRVSATITAMRPRSPGVDDLAALSVAADAARSAGAPHADLVLLDSGLDDRGALDFTVPGLLAAIPAEVASQLRNSGNQPDLRGFTVELVGIGYSAAPQPPLAAKWRSNLTQIWAAVAASGGGRVEVIPQPGMSASIRTSQPVKLIPLPADHPVRPAPRASIVFTGESPVRFEPDSTAFVDPGAARRALTPIARWLAADPSRHARLVGTTADVGPLGGQIALSRQRAGRVRGELIALGASAGQISVTGAGSDFPQFIPDRSAAGTLLAGPATLNRSVRITLSSG